QRIDRDFDPGMHLVWTTAVTPGYHTLIADGAHAHSTCESMNDALAMLRSDQPIHVERANDVIDRIVSLQVTDPLLPHYGIWGWFAEEAPEQMSPADWNWADFIGVRLAQALIMHLQQLRPATTAGARRALHHAAMAIFRRNVTPAYTNIAIMGAVACATAGELLVDAGLLDYARQRINAVVDLRNQTGGFSEYNSPAYTRILIEEAERGLMLVKDESFRAASEMLRRLAWQAIAERFHPATGQLAGPQSRAYSNWITSRLAAYLTEQTGIPVHGNEDDESRPDSLIGKIDVVRALPCPEEFLPRFRELPSDPFEVRTRFSADKHGDVVGTTWFTRDVCFGTINRDITWTQRRVLLAYWAAVNGTDGGASILRARMMFNGRDLAAGVVYQMQRGPRALSAWSICHDSGTFHMTLDRRPDNRYPMRDLRVIVSLAGPGAQARQLDEWRFELSAGGRCAIVHTAAGEFMGKPVRWMLSHRNDRSVYLNAVLYEGPEIELDLSQADLTLACAVELLDGTDIPSTSPIIRRQETNEGLVWQWSDLEVRSSPRALTMRS
ncbi:MAG: hypothetical protein JWM57_143, partial [Phycisphaerales bacterium]|nr:hypothetical protein [Phycisphaerales bacterium]